MPCVHGWMHLGTTQHPRSNGALCRIIPPVRVHKAKHQQRGSPGFPKAKEDRRPKIPSNTDDELARLITMCWHGEQQSRPSFYYVVQMLASMIRDNFNPFTVSLKTVVRAETALVNVQGNSTVNVDAGVSLVQDDV